VLEIPDSNFVILTLTLESGTLIKYSIQRKGKNSVSLSTIILIVWLLGFFLEVNKPWTGKIPKLLIFPSPFYPSSSSNINPFEIFWRLNW
jgi:hypothetical protein